MPWTILLRWGDDGDSDSDSDDSGNDDDGDGNGDDGRGGDGDDGVNDGVFIYLPRVEMFYFVFFSLAPGSP